MYAPPQGHTLPHLLIFTFVTKSFSLPQSVKDPFWGPPLLIIMTSNLIYIPSLHTGRGIFQAQTLAYPTLKHKIGTESNVQKIGLAKIVLTSVN